MYIRQVSGSARRPDDQRQQAAAVGRPPRDNTRYYIYIYIYVYIYIYIYMYRSAYTRRRRCSGSWRRLSGRVRLS